ncbi:hypothetical protein CVT25_008432 [Psilocybe cyanescens]|uniref:CHAT domain-containing protein n=1 Tax=Psilocybe cyanescens TaxID=93625 RepID=A0A409WUU9_PSICY|nr:hypothetical protein CVT25_008432 [Psilocybe cyanescens]
MSESKLPDDYHNSEPRPTQGPGSHMVHMSGGETGDAETSAQKSPQSPVRDVGPAECGADTGGNVTATDDLSYNEEVFEIVAFATSLMEEYKAGLSLSNLDTALFLFRQVFDDHPTTHPLHTDAMKHLASALGVRFMHTNKTDNLVESLTLRLQISNNLDPERDTSDDNASLFEDEAEDALELAKGLLADFQKSTSLHVLDTIVSLLQQSLAQLSSASTIRFAALTTLVYGLYARFKHDTNIGSLDEAISCLQDAVNCCTEQDGQQSKLNSQNRLCGLLMERFDLTGDKTDLQAALASLGSGNFEDTETATDIRRLFDFTDELFVQFTKWGDVGALNIVVALFREVMAKMPQESEDHIFAINNLATALSTRFRHGGDKSDLDGAISLYKQVLELQPSPHPDRSMSLSNLATALWIRFRQGGQQSDLNEAISFHKQALELFHPPHPNRLMSLNNLAAALWVRFQQRGQRGDLNDAISHHRQALELQPSPHPSRSMSLTNLATALWTRFRQDGQQSDLNEAISLFRQALELRLSPHPERYLSLTNLANALSMRFLRIGQKSDLNEAISLYRQALELRLSPHPDRSTSLDSLANALSTRFDSEQGGERSDLDESISLHREILEVQLSPHPRSLSNLANALSARFAQGGQRSDLNESISLHRQALELRLSPDPDRFTSLNNLSNVLSTRFEQGGEQTDLNEAISLHRQALELSRPPHPNQSMSLNNLASILTTRFGQGGQRDDLDEAISLYRQALELRFSSHPDRSMSLNGLATALLAQFEHGGRRSDLDEAIALHRQALELFRPPHRDRPMSLNNLATALSIRFRQGGQISDLDEAISLNRQALELYLSPHSGRSMSLNNLATALSIRFRRAGQRSDLDEAISLHRQALELRPSPHPDRYVSLSNLATALMIQSRQRDRRSDLDESISLHRQALELQLLPHPNRSTSLNYLASALSTRSQQRGQKSDLSEAISLHRQALELQLPPHTSRSRTLNDLATALWIQFDQGGERSDLDEAMALFSYATQYLFRSPSHRLYFAKTWIHYAEKTQHNSTIHAYEAALQILPQVAALSLDVESRQKALTDASDGLARDASICAIRSGNVDKAIQLLEGGRSIFWSQLLSLRSPFDQLRSITPNGPELADRLRDIASELEVGSHRDVSAEILDNRKKVSIDQEASRLNRLNEEWATTILKIRELSGFEDFLLPPRLSSLKPAADEHPVIFLIPNDNESHCLIMTSTIIHDIALPNLRTPILKILVDNMRMAVSQSSISRSFIDKTREAIIKLLGEQRGISLVSYNEDSDGIFIFVLRMLCDEVVKPIINFLEIKKSDEMPVLQWCPTGYFTFLPIHAAGCYNIDLVAIDCAPDYFISSYTPTIGALLAEPSAPTAQTKFQMMAVIQSQDLGSTNEELKKIRQYVSRDALIALGIPESPARVEDVASRLSDVSMVHFACHGMQDVSKPLDSGLKLDDGLLRISRIMKEKMPKGSLAFLCVCETAMGDQHLPDEAMSLAACLIFSGFRRVVATMWEMMDKDGPIVADAFYRELFRGPDGEKTLEPDVTKSAYALHTAVKELRSRKVSFRRWVPFIHMGK